MLKAHFSKVTLIAAATVCTLSAPAMALSGVAEAEFEAEISEARAKMMGHSAAALEHARNANKIARGESTKAQKARLTARWLEAEALMRLNRSGEASPIIEGALSETAGSFNGSKLHADLLRSHGSLQARQGNFTAALPAFDKAQELYKALGENRSRSIVLLSVGSVYSGARNFDRALSVFQEAKETFPDDPALSLSAHNNSGNALKGLGRYTEAETEFTLALEVAQAKNSPLLNARILTNIAAVQVMDGRTQAAEATAHKAMELAREHGPNWARFVDGVLAQVELNKGDLDRAQAHIEQTFEGEDLEATAAHFRDFHESAVQIYERAGQTAQSKLHLTALQRLDAQVAQLER
jgi:tetratricopeptide (TPR) repeat protein